MLRAARLQNEIAPEINLIDTKKGLKNANKDPQNDPKRVRKLLKPLSCRLKISLRHFSKSFSPPIICTKKSVFFTARLCRGSRSWHMWGWGCWSCFDMRPAGIIAVYLPASHKTSQEVHARGRPCLVTPGSLACYNGSRGSLLPAWAAREWQRMRKSEKSARP